jgi:hypothetical protein
MRFIRFESSKSKVPSMAKKEPEKEKTVKVSKPKQGPPGGDDKVKKAKAKPTAEATAEKEKAAAAEALAKEKEKEKAKAAPRPPADPRLKVLKKFHGKFLPKGPLRERLKTLMTRWDSGEDHGGVTVDELKSLHNDWKTARAKPVKAAAASR